MYILSKILSTLCSISIVFKVKKKKKNKQPSNVLVNLGFKQKKKRLS